MIKVWAEDLNLGVISEYRCYLRPWDWIRSMREWRWLSNKVSWGLRSKPCQELRGKDEHGKETEEVWLMSRKRTKWSKSKTRKNFKVWTVAKADNRSVVSGTSWQELSQGRLEKKPGCILVEATADSHPTAMPCSSLVTRTLVLFRVKCIQLYFLISLSSRCDRVRQISRSVYGISGKPAERELVQPGSTLCISHFCPLYWSDFYCDSSMKQTTQKYLNDLPHSLLCFWVSSLAGLAEQACILGFGSGSGQLQFQAERKICCSHGGMGASRSLVEICHTS